MDLVRSVRAVTEASGAGMIDWQKTAESAKAATDPGDLQLTASERDGYASDVRDARTRLREVADIDFDVPATVEVQNRHHWIDANLRTFRQVMGAVEQNLQSDASNVSRIANTGSMAFSLGFLARNVLGQYDPLLMADSTENDHGLYFVHSNIKRTAEELDVPFPRFRRWIAFHEVSHAAEFGAAPWLSGYLESRMDEGVAALGDGALDRDSFQELNGAMTAVEGYAELLMDRAFDQEYADLRRKLDERRGGGSPISKLIRRVLGLGMKRQQYEQGSSFFEVVADRRDIQSAGAVWADPTNLPTGDELNDPDAWIQRVNP